MPCPYRRSCLSAGEYPEVPAPNKRTEPEEIAPTELVILVDVVAAGLTGRTGLIVKTPVPRPLQFELAALWNPANPSAALSNFLALLPQTVADGKANTFPSASITRRCGDRLPGFSLRTRG